MEQKISDNFLTTALTKWGNKWWFKVLFVIVVIWITVGPFITSIVNNSMQKEHISESINTTLDDRDADASRRHKANFEASRQAYALAKHTMQEYQPLTKAEYIFLIEFHNGTENAITGVQFCRFDMTLEVVKENLQYVQIEKFKDDIVARYDILLSDDLSKNKVLYYTKSEFEKVDRYLAYQMEYVNAKSYALVNLKDKDGKIFGALLCVSNDKEDIDLLAVRELAITLEDIFTSSIK